jgi:hypothetical protein
MRRRLNIERARDTELSEPVREAVRVVLDHVSSGERNPKKRKPGGGNAGFRVCCYRSLRFQVCGLAAVHPPKSGESVFVFLVQPMFSSSSSTFLFFGYVPNLTEAFANSHRFLSVCALTRPWAGTGYKSKTHAMSEFVCRIIVLVVQTRLLLRV